MKVKINSFSDLMAYLEQSDVTVQMIRQIATEGLKVIILDNEATPYTKEQTIQILSDWWNKYKDSKSRPLFIPEIDLDCN
jgi:hypothetical protein